MRQEGSLTPKALDSVFAGLAEPRSSARIHHDAIAAGTMLRVGCTYVFYGGERGQW
jgi:hypothetical protein